MLAIGHTFFSKNDLEHSREYQTGATFGGQSEKSGDRLIENTDGRTAGGQRSGV
jgi:hypothetical protein